MNLEAAVSAFADTAASRFMESGRKPHTSHVNLSSASIQNISVEIAFSLYSKTHWRRNRRSFNRLNTKPFMSRFLVFLLVLLAPALARATPNSDPAQLYSTFLRDRAGFSWRLVSRSSTVTTLELTSQKWKGTTWKHRVVIYQPRKLQFPDAAALFLTTRPLPWDKLTGQRAADAIGAPFCIVYDVPNQPLWGRTENGLFGYSISRALQTGDGSWSLAFPMAKTAVRALDAVDACNAKSKANRVKRWIMIGFSKRALAAWLASTDPRVQGLVSLAYNNLNTPKQAAAQRADWGELSPRLQPYLANGVEAAMSTPRGQAILATWDPYSFRARLNKPKLVVDATGNDYWSLRAFDQYADDLPGATNFLMESGTDHYMVSSLTQVFDAATSWSHRTLSGRELPQPKLTRAGDNWIFVAPDAESTTLHYARSETHDFRGANWQEIAMSQHSNGFWEAEVPEGAGKLAVFATGNWKDGERKLPLSSRVIVW